MIFCRPIIERSFRQLMRPGRILLLLALFFVTVFWVYGAVGGKSLDLSRKFIEYLFNAEILILIFAGGYNAFTALYDEFRFGSFYFIAVLPDKDYRKILSLIVYKNIGTVFLAAATIIVLVYYCIKEQFVTENLIMIHLLLFSAAIFFWMLMFFCAQISQKTGELFGGYAVLLLLGTYFYQSIRHYFLFCCRVGTEQIEVCESQVKTLILPGLVKIPYPVFLTILYAFLAALLFFIIVRIYKNPGSSYLELSHAVIVSLIMYTGIFVLFYYRFYYSSWSDFISAALVGFAVNGTAAFCVFGADMKKNMRNCSILFLLYLLFLGICSRAGTFNMRYCLHTAGILGSVFLYAVVLGGLYQRIQIKHTNTWFFWGISASYIIVPWIAADKLKIRSAATISFLNQIGHVSRMESFPALFISATVMLSLYIAWKTKKAEKAG